QVIVQNVQGRQSQGYSGNARYNQASGTRVINVVGNTGANQPRADHVDAYDSDYDNEATSNGIFMENLSLVGSLNNDLVAPRYDSDTDTLSTEQLYWSSVTSPPVTVSKPKVFPKKVPSTSEVLKNLNKAQDLLTKFDECIKRRTTLSPHEIGSWEQSDIKGTFKADVIPLSENLKETFNFFEKGFIAKVEEMKDIFKQIEDEVD
ncbi:hypothetical protein Tco_0692792, partial [Tanacetum coccineum]